MASQADLYCAYEHKPGTHVFYLDTLKKYDLRQMSKAIDIALSRMLYPRDTAGWKEGQSSVVILVRPTPENGFPGDSLAAAQLVAIRYLHLLLKRQVELATGIKATTNEDVAWHTSVGIGEPV